MPARRSEDPSLTDAEKTGEGAARHWDGRRRAQARPAPFERSLPDRDHLGVQSDGRAGTDPRDPGMACDDGGEPANAPEGLDATDR